MQPNFRVVGRSGSATALNGRERAVVLQAADGDSLAREELVRTFMPLIESQARNYRNSPAVNRTELRQEGVVGLLRALERFDPELGTPFWAYASWWVRQAMQQLVAEMTRPIVLSDRAVRQLVRVKEARRNHLQAHAREPTTTELAESTGFSREHLDSLTSVERPPRSLEEPMRSDDNGSTSLGECVGDPISEDGYDAVMDRQEEQIIRSLTEELDAREREIVYSHYGLGRKPETLREIAGRLKLSAERVRQVEERALTRIRMAATG